MKKFLILCGILLVVVMLVIRNSGLTASAPEVETEALAERPIRSSILASGRLSHEDEVQLTTEVIGVVTEVLVKEGMEVTQGQLLLRIDDEAILANVAQSSATMRMQEIAIRSQELRVQDLERQMTQNSRLHEGGILNTDSFATFTNELALARIELLSRQEALTQARATLEEINNRLSKTRVHSPMDGVITSLDIEPGETAISSTTNIPGSSLMTIANPDSILTEVNVDEADIANVEVGQRAEIVAIAYPDQPMTGRVESIAMSAKRAEGSQSLSFVVKIRFTDTAGVVLRPGMSCRAEIFTHQDLAVAAAPIRAIQIEEDLASNRTDYSLFVYEDGIAQRRTVQVGISDDQYQAITGGVDLGERIITGPDRILRGLDDGDRVQTATLPAGE